MDAGNFDGVGELFAGGALVDPDGNELARGRDSVADFYRRIVLLHAGSPQTRHVTANSIIELNDSKDTATARSSFVVYQTVDGSQTLIAAGRYEDRLQRVGDEWRFAERRFFVDQLHDVSRHLTP